MYEAMLEVLFSVMVAMLPVSWIWSLYHIVKCHGKRKCENRKCTYWDMCTHNKQARRADAARRRMELLEEMYGEINNK